MNKKYLIFSGCSYTFRSPWSITQQFFEPRVQGQFEILDLRASGAGNEFIVEMTTMIVDHLLSLGTPPENIIVINNFTQIYRPVVKLPVEYYPSANKLFEKYEEILLDFKSFKYSSIRSLLKVKNQIYTFLISDDYLEGDLKKWITYQIENPNYTQIAHQYFENYLSNIVLLQTYLDKKNVKNISFLMNNVFEGWFDDLSHLYSKKRGPFVPNLEGTKHISEISDYTKILWDSINLDNFVFHQTQGNKFGGIDEYMIEKFNDKKYIQDEIVDNFYFGNHPLHDVYISFAKEYMFDEILNWYNNTKNSFV